MFSVRILGTETILLLVPWLRMPKTDFFILWFPGATIAICRQADYNLRVKALGNLHIGKKKELAWTIMSLIGSLDVVDTTRFLTSPAHRKTFLSAITLFL